MLAKAMNVPEIFKSKMITLHVAAWVVAGAGFCLASIFGTMTIYVGDHASRTSGHFLSGLVAIPIAVMGGYGAAKEKRFGTCLQYGAVCVLSGGIIAAAAAMQLMHQEDMKQKRAANQQMLGTASPVRDLQRWRETRGGTILDDVNRSDAMTTQAKVPRSITKAARDDYYHSAITPVIVRPGTEACHCPASCVHRAQDGHDKQDCQIKRRQALGSIKEAGGICRL
jgi:hypothetical protein